jgi:hypothetical protein
LEETRRLVKEAIAKIELKNTEMRNEHEKRGVESEELIGKVNEKLRELIGKGDLAIEKVNKAGEKASEDLKKLTIQSKNEQISRSN